MDSIFRLGLIKAVKEASAKYADLPGYEQKVQEHVDILEKLFEKMGEKEIKPGRPAQDEVIELISKIRSDVEKLKQKICGDDCDGRYIIATQDPGMSHMSFVSDKLLKQLGGEIVKPGPAQKGTITGGTDRYAVRKPDGKMYYVFDEIANYPSGPGKVRNTQTPKESEQVKASADGLKALQKLKDGTWKDKLSGFLIPLPIRNPPPKYLPPHTATSRPVGRWMKYGPIDQDVVERLKKATDRGTAIADELRNVSEEDTENKFSCFLRAVIPPSIEYLMNQLWSEEDKLEVNKRRLEYYSTSRTPGHVDEIRMERIRDDIKKNESNIEHLNIAIKLSFKGATKSYLLSSRDYLKRVIRDAEEYTKYLEMLNQPHVNTQMNDRQNRKVQWVSRLITLLKMVLDIIDEELAK